MALTALKMAVFAPMPSARVRITMALKAGLLASRRRLYRRSWSRVSMGGSKREDRKRSLLDGVSRRKVARPLLPRSQQASHRHELSYVIGIVVHHEQQLPKVGLAGAVRDFGEEVDRRVRRQRAQVLAVAAESLQALI